MYALRLREAYVVSEVMEGVLLLWPHDDILSPAHTHHDHSHSDDFGWTFKP